MTDIQRLIQEAVAIRARPTVQISTVNLDHLALAKRNPKFRKVLLNSTVCVPDGMGSILVGRFQGDRLPERVAGSDLTRWLVDGGVPGIRMFLLGSTPNVVEHVAGRANGNGAVVVGTATPLREVFKDSRLSARLVQQVNRTQPDVLLLALGAPLQETWIQQWAWNLDVSVAMGVGASLDFLAGAQRRAPLPLRRLGFEWLFRLACNPRRLGRRYIRRDIPFLAGEAVRIAAWRLARSRRSSS